MGRALSVAGAGRSQRYVDGAAAAVICRRHVPLFDIVNQTFAGPGRVLRAFPGPVEAHLTFPANRCILASFGSAFESVRTEDTNGGYAPRRRLHRDDPSPGAPELPRAVKRGAKAPMRSVQGFGLKARGIVRWRSVQHPGASCPQRNQRSI